MRILKANDAVRTGFFRLFGASGPATGTAGNVMKDVLDNHKMITSIKLGRSIEIFPVDVDSTYEAERTYFQSSFTWP